MKKIFLFLVIYAISLIAQSNYQLYKESLKRKNLKEAKIYLLKAINESFENDDLKTIAKRYEEMANLYKKTKSYYKAIEYYKLSLKLSLSEESSDIPALILLYKKLSFCYSKIGNTFKTFKYSYKAAKLANKRYGKNSKVTKELTKELAKIQSKLIENSI